MYPTFFLIPAGKVAYTIGTKYKCPKLQSITTVLRADVQLSSAVSSFSLTVSAGSHW